MSNDLNHIELFDNAREYLLERVEPTLQAFFCGIWDPLSKFVIIREIDNILNKELKQVVPDLLRHMRPQFKYRICEEDLQIEVSVQRYLNKERRLNYLGSAEIGAVIYDLYYRDSYDGTPNTVFLSRYGHLEENYLSGSKTAEAEYFLGEMTPLSVAYGLAVEDNII